MNSAEKGFSFERKLAKILSLWVSGGTDCNILWRQGGSGGRATALKKKGIVLEEKSGDIVLYKDTPEAQLFSKHFFVEAKCVAGGDLFPKSAFFKTILKYVDKAKSEAQGRIILLVIKQNYKEEYIIIPDSPFRLKYDIIFPTYNLYAISLSDFVKTDFKEMISKL